MQEGLTVVDIITNQRGFIASSGSSYQTVKFETGETVLLPNWRLEEVI
jgi:hypothetical protein